MKETQSAYGSDAVDVHLLGHFHAQTDLLVDGEEHDLDNSDDQQDDHRSMTVLTTQHGSKTRKGFSVDTRDVEDSIQRAQR